MADHGYERTMRLNAIVQEVQRFGALKTFQHLTFKAINRLMLVKILKGVKIETVQKEFLECDSRYRGGFLSQDVLTEIARSHPEYDLPESFLGESFARGDECYGFLDGSVLAAYGWYSNKPTALNFPGIVLHFDNRYIYMYKGFTHVKYRGQRLHAVAMTRALQEYLARGYKGIVSYVEWDNFSSLKSCYRMGYVDFGNLYLVRIFHRYLIHAERSCKPYGFRLEHP